ncbi:MAG: NAD(P)H-dependent oxidoreductase subunit E [Defluviitaleaceae bacterium]|nr:NAD(P)H-dependent oxidoreductase subunit E [Defluviitaleaceae bacterium]
MEKNEKALFAELDAHIDALPSKQGALISVLHKAQDIFGYLPREVQTHVAQKLDIPASKVYGVLTFYSFFTMTQKGKNRVNVCMGTACFVRGADKILHKFERDLNMKANTTSEDGLWSLDALRCIGACGLAPIITVNGKSHGRLVEDDVTGIIEACLAEEGGK